MLSSGVNLYIQLHLHLLPFSLKKIISVHNGGKFMINFHERRKKGIIALCLIERKCNHLGTFIIFIWLATVRSVGSFLFEHFFFQSYLFTCVKLEFPTEPPYDVLFCLPHCLYCYYLTAFKAFYFYFFVFVDLYKKSSFFFGCY